MVTLLLNRACFASLVCLAVAVSGCNKASETESGYAVRPGPRWEKGIHGELRRAVTRSAAQSVRRPSCRTSPRRADLEHTSQWFMELIRNPKSKNPKARMRAFNDSIKEDDLRPWRISSVSLK